MQEGDTVLLNDLLTLALHPVNTCGRNVSFQTERVITDMQPSIFQSAECGMKTKKFLQGERRKTILGELRNKVVGREIEWTFKINTDENCFCIAKLIYDKLKDDSGKSAFSLLRVGIIGSIILQTQYESSEHDLPFKRKITVNLYEREQAAVIKIKSPTVRKYKRVKIKEESKFFVPCINGSKPENSIKDVFDENISCSLKEGNSWKKEKYQIFIEFNKNIFTIAVSQIYMLQEHDDFMDVQSTAPLRRIEVEYQGTRYGALSETVQVKESEETGTPDSIKVDKKIERDISKQIRKISQRVQEICQNE